MYELEGRKGEERGMGKRKGVRPAAFFGFCAFAAAAGLRPAAAAAVVCPLTLWNKGYKVTNGIAFVTTVPFWGFSRVLLLALRNAGKRWLTVVRGWPAWLKPLRQFH